MVAQFLNASGRDFQIYGSTLVGVQGGQHLSGYPITSGVQLGLTIDQIKVRHFYRKKPVYVDDFGPETPVEIMTMGGWVDLHMQLSHYDRIALDLMWNESKGGPPSRIESFNSLGVDNNPITSGDDILVPINVPVPDGTLLPAGTMLGHGLPLYSSGCHYFTTYLQSQNYGTTPALNQPAQGGNINMVYLACYLPTEPLEIPLGAKASIVDLTIRCIPYRVVNPTKSQTNVVGEILASGIKLWNTTIGPYPGV